ncbi:MAG: fibronectin type III domain-containing protein [Flavobacteriales bacterium]
MKKVFYIVKLGHSRVTPVALVDKSRTNVTMMTGNATYATPNPTLAAITSSTNKLDTAIQAYDFTRSRLDKETRDTTFNELKELRTLLGSYVQNESAGEQSLISSAGFETEKVRQPKGVLSAPQNVRAIQMPYPGQIEVRFDGVNGRNAYQLFVCSGDPKIEGDWALWATTGKNRVVVNELASDKVYFFRVVAIGAAGASPVSDSATAKAA